MTALVLALVVSATPEGRTVYLVRPLYPGQELLAQRTEAAVGRLFQPEARARQLIGRAELAEFLKGKSLDLACVLGDAACNDPTDAAIRALGVEWILLVKGGQEESAYRFVVTAYNPTTGETLRAEAPASGLEKALLGALVKVVPLASTVEIDCDGGKATVFVDGERVGETPYKGQILPGERALRLESEGFIPHNETITLPARGVLTLRRTLSGTPGKLIVRAVPDDAVIAVDGTVAGKSPVEKALSPGSHKITATREGYHAYEATVTIKPEQPYTAELQLEPTTAFVIGQSFKQQRENIVKRTSSFALHYERTSFGALIGSTNPAYGGSFQGASFEFAFAGGIGGVLVVGPAIYAASAASVQGSPSKTTVIVLRALQPYLRLSLWRLVFMVQAGIEGRRFQNESEDPIVEKEKLDLQIGANLNVRAFLWEGLFAEAALRQTFDLFGMGVGPWWGFNAGVGYAF